MPVTIHIPTPLRPYVGGRDALEAPAGTVAEILARLVAQHGSLRAHLFNDEGRLRSFVNVYLGDRNIRELAGEATPAADGAEISIVPSIAGGAAFIRYVPPDEIPASDRVPDADNILRVHGVHPAVMRQHYDLHVRIMRGASPLSRIQREMIAVAVSSANHCRY